MNRDSSSMWLSTAAAAALVALVATSTDAVGAPAATPTPSLQSSTFNSLTLSWPPVPEAQQYVVMLCKVAMCRDPQLFTVGTTTSTTAAGEQVVYTLKDLSPSTPYYIYVQANILTPETVKGIFSIAVNATTPAAPPVTLRAQLENDDGKTCFYYTLPAGTSKASLQTYDDATDTSPSSGYLDTTQTSQCYLLNWNVGDACPSKYYSVKASASGGRRWESEKVRPDCPCPTPPAAPTNFTVKLTDGKDCRNGIDLSWTAPPPIEGCTANKVQIGSSQGMYPTVIATVDVGTQSTVRLPISSIAATNVFLGKTYTYTVAVKNERGAGSASSSASVYCQ
jgi:hypothetical protein